MNDRFSPDDLPTSGAGLPPRPVRPVDLAHIPPFRVGPVEVRPATLEVVGGERRELLEPRVMQVLVALARAGGEILSRDDLITACWEGRAVTDDAINRVLSRLRALARTIGGFEIETITKVGYRLVADAVDEPAEAETIDAQPSGSVIPRRALIAGGAAVAAVAAGGWFAWEQSGGGSRQPSVAVLPFANLSGDPGRQYFADGMAEELRTALARINRLKVIGRTSSESVRDVEARKAAARLGVAYVLLGSIRQSPTTIRVTAQLVDGSDGVALWSETYDRGPGDILAIQSDIARSVAQALVPRLAPDEQAALAAGSTSSAAAHDLMLKALALDASSDSEEAQRRAVGYMDAAIALDPQYADAHAMRSLRLAQVARSYLESVADMRAMVDEAARSARRAIVIAPNLASGYSALGWAMHYQLDFGNALKQLELSYRLGRGDARTVRIYATYLLLIGRTDQALKHAAESDALDPLHPRHQQMVAQIHFAAQRYEAAAAASRRTLQLAPTRLEPLYILATSLVMLGRTQEAQAAIAKLPHGNVRRLTIEAILYSRIGDKVSADRAIGQIERHGDLANFELAQVHAQRGRNEEALALLDGAWRNRDPDMTRVATDPLFAPLRGDAKFQALIKRLRLPA